MFRKKRLKGGLEDTISSPERYKRWTLSQLQVFEGLLGRHGYSIARFDSIMELGCSFGRVLCHVNDIAPKSQVYGCDVLPEMLAKCRKILPDGKFIVNESTPPLDFPDESFDWIYTFSVFTHLSEPNHKAWLKELASKLKPGGVMLHTTHGYECLRRLAVFNPENLVKYKIPGTVEEFTSQSLRYHYNANNPLMPEYGVTIISRDYILKNWENYSGLKLLEHAEGVLEVSPEGNHDLVLMAKDVG